MIFLKEQGVNDLSDFVQSFILLLILISQLDPACVKSDCVCVCVFFLSNYNSYIFINIPNIVDISNIIIFII